MSKKKKHHHEEHIDETWLIPYADMLTLLLALFIVMFATSQVDTQRFEMLKKALESVFKGGTGIMLNPSTVETEGASDEAPDLTITDSIMEARYLDDLKEKIDQLIDEQGLTNQIYTGIVQEGLQVSFRDAALFDSGRANLRPEALPVLNELSILLDNIENEIRVAGHTDNLPINTPEFPSNWDLSAKRSLNVMKYILNNNIQLNPARFTAVGYSEYRPIATNDTIEGRAQNRRVEIMIIRQFPEAVPGTNTNTNISPGSTSAEVPRFIDAR
ncbi:OmpA family protein [Heliorestis acidaminivorans]|uniref:OmpA family protein n=1 Tax=Heliorestis acidaminivorans TaxID=553427 RepID=A0A6I0F0X3_9FIRM|nr:flagellar motor protein MotB [Heliorestis acidaminivorans]KAB2953486.1 OmpA family protein [Heliorestis acidaminivorans]